MSQKNKEKLKKPVGREFQDERGDTHGTEAKTTKHEAIVTVGTKGGRNLRGRN